MKIGVISDTHDRLESIKKAVAIFKANKVEVIVHCGDWISPFVVNYFDNLDVKGILGNNKGDIRKMRLLNRKLVHPLEIEFAQESKEFILEGQKYLIIHGDDEKDLNKAILSKKFQAIFTGHDHQVQNKKIGQTLVINPGSTSFIIEGKMVNVATITIYDSDKNQAEIIRFNRNDVYTQNN